MEKRSDFGFFIFMMILSAISCRINQIRENFSGNGWDSLLFNYILLQLKPCLCG